MAIFPVRRVKLDITDDILGAVDSLKANFDMNRSAFVRYLLRRALRDLGVTEEELAQFAESRQAAISLDKRIKDNH